MYLKTLQLEWFRNYSLLELQFPEISRCCFVGHNGAGKSNILQALFCLSTSKTFFGQPFKTNLSWEYSQEDTGHPGFFRIKGRGVNPLNTQEFSREVLFNRLESPQKLCFVNEEKAKSTDFYGGLPVVAFTPRDMELLSGSPQQRRRYLDIFISQIDPEYLMSLRRYKAVLKQRNALLKKINSTQDLHQLDYWDAQLISNGSYLSEQRSLITDRINNQFNTEYSAISKFSPELSIKWSKHQPLNWKELYQEHFTDKRFRDWQSKSTLFGAHREDFSFFFGEQDITWSASRGELRSALIALKVIESRIIAEKLKINPIVLLDDVLSELDSERQRYILEVFKDFQVFLSSTEIPSYLKAHVFLVEKGKVNRKK